MATLTLRPISGSGSNWSNITNTYDGNTSTSGTVSVTSSTYSSRVLTLNFDTSAIPAGVTINSATLTIVCKQSSSNSSRRITPYVDINGDSSKRVLNTRLTTTQSTTQTSEDISSYILDLTTVTVTPYVTTLRSGTFTLYEVYITVDYTESIKSFTVTFKDWDGTVLKTETVQSGGSATAPSNPSREGYNFTGWDNSFTNITSDLVVTAQYEVNSSGGSDSGGSTGSGNIKRYTFECTGYSDGGSTGETLFINNELTLPSSRDDITNALSSEGGDYVYIVAYSGYMLDEINLKVNNIENVENIKSAKLGIKYDNMGLYGYIYNSLLNININLTGSSTTELYDITQYITSNTFNIDLSIESMDEEIMRIIGGAFDIDYVYLDIEYNDSSTSTGSSNIYLSDTKINKIYIGDKSISKIFLGDKLLFNN